MHDKEQSFQLIQPAAPWLLDVLLNEQEERIESLDIAAIPEIKLTVGIPACKWFNCSVLALSSLYR
jgi:hypothetical protein